jgi:rhamnose utilization protein RhaD (predicted bifunctional aldolase and dehydrogenase)
MSCEHRPDLVGEELLGLTRALGRPERDLVILAEGNTSQRLEDGRVVVKASGARMRDATPEDFVTVEVEPLVALMDDPAATQADLTAALDAGVVGGRRRRGSIETLVHIAVQSVSPAAYVAHTHPTEVVGLLASVHAEEAFLRAAYSDEAVVLGDPLFVPYAQPGIDLGRVYYRSLREYADREGALPRLVLLANHGIVAIAPTAEGAEGITEMAVKGAAVRRIAYAVGGLAPLSTESVAKFVARDDVTERRANISAGVL